MNSYILEGNIFERQLNDPLIKQDIKNEIDSFALSHINKSQSVKNRLLSTRIVDFEKGGESANEVGNSLADLNMKITDLDPSGIDFMKSGLLGRFYNPARKYFNRFKKSSAIIEHIIESLYKGKKSLENDNITIVKEQALLVKTNENLRGDIETLMGRDENIEAQIAKAELDDNVSEEDIKFVQEKVLYRIRQKTKDIDQLILVNQQSIMSLDVIKQNNEELIIGVDRAINITVPALKTGVMVARALVNQKIVLDKITNLNEATNKIIMANAVMLGDQAVDIQKLSEDTMLAQDILNDAMDKAIQATKDMQTYKIEALPKLKENIETFNQKVEEGQKVVDKMTVEA